MEHRNLTNRISDMSYYLPPGWEVTATCVPDDETKPTDDELFTYEAYFDWQFEAWRMTRLTVAVYDDKQKLISWATRAGIPKGFLPGGYFDPLSASYPYLAQVVNDAMTAAGPHIQALLSRGLEDTGL